mgnify:CR=1 FL=1
MLFARSRREGGSEGAQGQGGAVGDDRIHAQAGQAPHLVRLVDGPHVDLHARGMGGGDVKFALGIGLWLGWESAIIAVWTAFLIGGMMAAFLLLTRRKGRRDALPFGPCLAAGGDLAFLCGDVIWRLYWGLA